MMEQLNNKEFFSNHGIKNTRQKNMIFDILKEESLPLTADRVFFKAKEIDTTISLSTVYRILDIFVDKGMVLKSSITEDNKAVFELNRMEHKHYLVCIRCKKIMDVDNCPFEVYEKSLEQETSFQVTSHRLESYGYCPVCKTKE
ncbi:MAG TPA: transcriptional repressor [Pseudobacteroides sp.]|uniref:Fur family transcriptional regulator n=1 Tax=Pseudobacteroides sp. TaxID=1968840 RepID=UPI002F91ECFC